MTDRTYYDFFRDIRRILGIIKDGHLNIAALKSPNGYELQRMSMCLPFQFYIKGENRADAKIYIKKYDECFNFFDQEVQDFVIKYENKYLKQINNTDPFEFIQNINVFGSFYNKHSTFTRNMKMVHNIPLYSNPLSEKELSNITFIFEDDQNITLNYYLYYRDAQLETDEEFNNFYNQEIKNQLNTDDQTILDIEKKYNKIKNNKKEYINS